ncbi:hypothetical protein J1N35_040662 [Gossypium stocksii]|uniref:Uncharacterized protein n=1 Tax=Gossypium stocksii TaxID=47602 RepID=A0A9D3UEL3_9ROSI|nr:hypothetical protein J1N35_040662 [Gossypium stocksii]
MPFVFDSCEGLIRTFVLIVGVRCLVRAWAIMTKDINALLERLKFSEDESIRVISINIEANCRGFKA